MEEIENIPADELIVMSAIFHRAFNAAGCDPMCHCCQTMIPVGAKFKLATIRKRTFFAAGHCLELERDVYEGKVAPTFDVIQEAFQMPLRKQFLSFDRFNIIERMRQFETKSQEVMLCEVCTAETYAQKVVAEINSQIAVRDKPKGGCFRVNGKIVI